MDVVVGTLVLCSVNNIDMALRGNSYTSLARTVMAISLSFRDRLFESHQHVEGLILISAIRSYK
jgi:hypothetical protein